jgi:hypothetical protein
MKRSSHEPATGPLLIKPLAVHASIRVRITWTLADGSTFTDDDVTCPPMPVIEAKRKAHDAALVELARTEGQGQAHEGRN